MTILSQRERQEIWKQRINDYRSSGQKLSAWCKVNHVSRDTMKYWLDKESQEPCMASSVKPSKEQKLKGSMFVKAESETSSENRACAISIKIGKACVEAHAGLDIGLLSAVLKAVAEIC
jgi:hypothetical protein